MFWANISQDTEKHKILNVMYKLIYKLNEESGYKSPWPNCVKNILKDYGFLGIWESQVIPYSKEWFKQQDYLICSGKTGQQKSKKVASV